MNKSSTDKLFHCFCNDAPVSVPADVQQQAAANLFALGCYMHLQGESDAGLKACNNAFALVNEKGTTFSKQILASLDGNEAEYAGSCHASLEFNKLFTNAD